MRSGMNFTLGTGDDMAGLRPERTFRLWMQNGSSNRRAAIVIPTNLH